MNKSDLSPATLQVSPASLPDLRPARRLIVLVPEPEMDTAFMAQKIWELANTLEYDIQFLGLSKDATHEPGVRRQMVTLSAMVGYENISVETKIEIGNDWLAVVKSNWHEGDVIVCFAGHNSGLARRPLSQILQTSLNATVYILSDIDPQQDQPRSWNADIMAWTGSLGIILGFFWLQATLIQFPKQWVYMTLFYISLFLEAGSLYGWNSLFD